MAIKASDFKKAKAQASKLFPSSVPSISSASRASAPSGTTSAKQAAKNAEGLFPSAYTQPPMTPPPVPFDYHTTKNVGEVQTETVTATGGNRTISFGGYTTGALNHNANAATIKSALEGLTSIGAGNIEVEQFVNGSVITNVYTFKGTLKNTNVATMTVAVGSLTGGTSTIVTTRPSIQETVQRQITQDALASKGWLRSPSQANNQTENWNKPKHKDIGDPNRVAGEDFDNPGGYQK